jgi:hypothetical protein
MLTSYVVACPHENCGWTGSLFPSLARAGARAEITSGRWAWFQCPRCARAWEVRTGADQVVILPAVEHGG